MEMSRKDLAVTAMSIGLIISLTIASGVMVGSVAADHYVYPEDGYDHDDQRGQELFSATDEQDPVVDTNYTIVLDNHQPGAEGTTVGHYAEGWSEDFVIHHITGVSESGEDMYANPTDDNRAFDYSGCSATDATAFGIDRGSSYSGSKTDDSLLASYEDFDSKEDKITITYWNESQVENQLAASTMTMRVEDQFVGVLSDCNTNPSTPGWYQAHGWMNGSTTASDETETNFANMDYTNYVYICDCENEDEAREQLGPPPKEKSNPETLPHNQESTPEPTEASGGTPEPTEASADTPEPTEASADTPEPTEASADTPEPTEASADTPEPTEANNGGGGGGGNSGGGENAGMTPTTGGGAGFGAVLALAAIAGAMLLFRRSQ
jgi:PGF-CTERM protein